jgi:hypothetical protein
MNKNVKVALIIGGVLVVGFVGYKLYQRYRMTSGNALKDLRKVTLKRTNPSQEVQLENEAQNTL